MARRYGGLLRNATGKLASCAKAILWCLRQKTGSIPNQQVTCCSRPNILRAISINLVLHLLLGSFLPARREEGQKGIVSCSLNRDAADGYKFAPSTVAITIINVFLFPPCLTWRIFAAGPLNLVCHWGNDDDEIEVIHNENSHGRKRVSGRSTRLAYVRRSSQTT